MDLLGIDNVLLEVSDIVAATAFYARLGFKLRFHLEESRIALFSIGAERPGLLLREVAAELTQGHFWVEVADAEAARREIEQQSPTATIETATGRTIEVRDPWGNIVGFADYGKQPQLARTPPGETPSSRF